MENPKPQRAQRPRRRKQDQKAKVEVKVTTKEKKRKPQPKKVITVHTENGLEKSMTLQKENQKLKQLERKIRRLGREEKGPKVNDIMTTTLTIGVIPGTTNKGLGRLRKLFLNPTLLKPSEAEEAATPLSIRSSQYDMWRVAKAHLTFRPLVSATVVTGSLCFADLDQEGAAAKPETVDTVKARPHVEVCIGQLRTWAIPRKFLVGPRHGWWYVDTNEDPTLSLGPAVNIWLYMATRNVFNAENATYDGPLFLAEMQVTYQFSNYNPKPGMQTMVTQMMENVSTGNAEFTEDIDGSLMLRVPANSRFFSQLKITDEAFEQKIRAERNGALGAKIWSLASDVVDTISTGLGPWSWLVKGGWFLIRRIFGNPDGRANEAMYFKVFSSVEDARSNEGIHASLSGSVPLPQGTYTMQQLTEPNVAGVTESALVTRVREIVTSTDYLPLSLATPPETTPADLPLVYQLVQAGEDETIVKQQLPSSAGYSGCFILAGSPVWWMYDVPEPPGSDIKGTLAFKATVPTAGEMWFSFEGKRILVMDLTRTGVLVGNNGLAGNGTMHTPNSLISQMKKLHEAGQMGQGQNRMFLRPTELEVSSQFYDWVPFHYDRVNDTSPDTLYFFDLRYEGDIDAKCIGVANLTTERVSVIWCGASKNFYPNSWMWFTLGWKPFDFDVGSGYENDFTFTVARLNAPVLTKPARNEYLGWITGPKPNTKEQSLPTKLPSNSDSSDISVIDPTAEIEPATELEYWKTLAQNMMQNPSSRV